MIRPFTLRLTLATVLLAVVAPTAQTPRYDVAIIGGQVADGSGSPRRRADIAIKDGRIATIRDSANREVHYGYSAAGNLQRRSYDAGASGCRTMRPA